MEAQKSFARGFSLLIWWTLVLSASVILLTVKRPALSAELIWRSREYTDSMMNWIRTGILPEGSPLSVIRVHLVQTLLYGGLALISANFLSLVLGSALLNYMNYYVVTVVTRSLDRTPTLWMAWNPWSIIRVLTFLYLGIVAGTPALWLLIPVPWTLRLELFMPVLAGLTADLFLKVFLSRKWSTRLNTFHPQPEITQS